MHLHTLWMKTSDKTYTASTVYSLHGTMPYHLFKIHSIMKQCFVFVKQTDVKYTVWRASCTLFTLYSHFAYDAALFCSVSKPHVCLVSFSEPNFWHTTTIQNSRSHMSTLNHIIWDKKGIQSVTSGNTNLHLKLAAFRFTISPNDFHFNINARISLSSLLFRYFSFN